MTPSYAVKWREPDGRAYVGRLELGERALHLVGADDGASMDRRVGYHELGRLRIGHDDAERVGGQRAVVVELAGGTYYVASATGETGVLHELVDDLFARSVASSSERRPSVPRPIDLPARHGRGRWPWRGILIALEVVLAVNAIAGGIYGLAGAHNVPRSWLDGSPFSSYLIPSLVLLLCVGGSAVAALAALLTGHARAPELAICCGAILLVWLIVEMLVIPFSWLQAGFLDLAVVMVVAGWILRRRRQHP